jgi:sec-independent protein translocase protein TatB
MFGIGITELIVLAVVALVFVGPDRLPQMMKQLGKFFVHTRRMATDVRSAMDTVIKDAEKEIRMQEIEDMKANLKNVSESVRSEAADILNMKEMQEIAKNAAVSSPESHDDTHKDDEHTDDEHTKTETNENSVDENSPNEHSSTYSMPSDEGPMTGFGSMESHDNEDEKK